MRRKYLNPTGRGAESNPKNRFETRARLPVIDSSDEVDAVGPQTQYLTDASRSIIATNASPDVGFDASINPYRGCLHGCTYCYARPTHEYLGFSAGLDFETKIVVKHDAPALLRRELAAKRWQPKVLAMSGVTDSYQPIERQLGLTRRCLEVLAEFRNPVCIVTKNALVLRDIDLLRELARHNAAMVAVSVTTLDPELCGVLEPRTSRPYRRLEAIAALAAAGIPTAVMVAPVIPALTDHEIPAILTAAARAGAVAAGKVVLRLPHGVAPLFEQWLAAHAPEKTAKVLNRIRALRGGKLYDASWETRQTGAGLFADQIEALFRLWCKKTGLDRGWPELTTAHFRRPAGDQFDLYQEP